MYSADDITGRPHSDSESVNYKNERNVSSVATKFHTVLKSHNKHCCSTSSNISYEENIGDAENKSQTFSSKKSPNLGCTGDVITRLKPVSSDTQVYKPGKTNVNEQISYFNIKSGFKSASCNLELDETSQSRLENDLKATNSELQRNSCACQKKYSKTLYSTSLGGSFTKEEITSTNIIQIDSTSARETLTTKVEGAKEQNSSSCPLKKSEEQYVLITGELQTEATPTPSGSRSEEEVRIQAREAKVNVLDEATAAEREVLDAYISEIRKMLTWKENKKTENKVRPDKTFFSKMDSSLKKNTAFVKKVKSFSAEHLESLLNDLSRLNLAKYLSEVATALVQAKLKVSDITPAVKLSIALCNLYEDFCIHLFQSWQKLLPLKEEGQFIGQKLLNVDLKFYTELISIGILPYEDAFLILTTVLSKIISADKKEYNHVCVLVSFFRHCIEGYSTPKKIQALAKNHKITLPTQMLLLPKEIESLKDLLKDYFECLMDHIFKERNELFIFQQQNKKILQTRGELSSERKGNWDNLRTSYEKLLSGMNTLAEVLGEDSPTFKADFTLNDIKLDGTSDATDQQSASSIWEDAEEQRFYESLTDMKQYAVSISGHHRLNKSATGSHHNHSEVDFYADSGEDTSDFSDEEDKKEFYDYGKSCDNEIGAFLCSLLNCFNCDMVDKLSITFLTTLYSKVNQKHLLRALFYVPRTRIDLLPFYARLVATLYPVIPLLAKDLAKKLKNEFKFRVQKKDQINIESKLKVVKYIGELVKFRIFSKFDALRCLKMLLNDFSHHHIEMCCALLESCGKFLLRNPESHEATSFFLEGMMRKKTVIPLESRYLTLIENAYYFVAPPEVPSTESMVLSPMQQFIKNLLSQKLSKNTADILDLLCQIDWEDTDIREFVISCLAAPQLIKYNNISFLASLVGGLSSHEDYISDCVVDAVMEDIRLGMEINLPMFNQSRLATIKYVGELFKNGVLNSGDIFRVLYSLISFGVCLKYPNTSALDPPNNLFRIRMACLLLETCGQYFRGSNTKKRLEYYLKYFKRYFLFKYEDSYWHNPENPFPVSICYIFHDALQTLQPQIYHFKSFQEANDAVQKTEAEVMLELPGNIHALNSDLEVDKASCNIDTVTNHILAQAASVEPIYNETEDRVVDDDFESLADVLSNTDAENCIDDMCVKCENKTVQQIPYSIRTRSSEDEEFMSEFNKMVQENMHQHLLEAVKPKHIDIAIPLHHKASLKKSRKQAKRTSLDEEKTFDVVLLMRRGHKQDYKQINIPSDSELALKLKRGEEEERAEKEKLKKLILDMNQRQEEEDYQELLSQQRSDLSIKKEGEFSDRLCQGHQQILTSESSSKANQMGRCCSGKFEKTILLLK